MSLETKIINVELLKNLFENKRRYYIERIHCLIRKPMRERDEAQIMEYFAKYHTTCNKIQRCNSLKEKYLAELNKGDYK